MYIIQYTLYLSARCSFLKPFQNLTQEYKNHDAFVWCPLIYIYRIDSRYMRCLLSRDICLTRSHTRQGFCGLPFYIHTQSWQRAPAFLSQVYIMAWKVWRRRPFWNLWHIRTLSMSSRGSRSPKRLSDISTSSNNFSVAEMMLACGSVNIYTKHARVCVSWCVHGTLYILSVCLQLRMYKCKRSYIAFFVALEKYTPMVGSLHRSSNINAFSLDGVQWDGRNEWLQ